MEEPLAFFGIAARLMRRVLVDYARGHRAIKRGGWGGPVTLEEAAALGCDRVPEIREVDQALDRLAEVDKRKASVIELRYFGGMTREEIAHFSGLTVGTVKRDLRLGEAWLQRHLMARD